MKHNVVKILALLQEGLVREQDLLKQLKLNDCSKRSIIEEKGVIIGIKLCIDWVENNI